MKDYLGLYDYNPTALDKTLDYSKHFAHPSYRPQEIEILCSSIAENKMVAPNLHSKWNTRQAIDFFNCIIRNKYYMPAIYCNQITKYTPIKQYSLATGKIIAKKKLQDTLSIISGQATADMLYKAFTNNPSLRNVVFDLKQTRCIDASHYDKLRDYQIPIGTLLYRDNMYLAFFESQFKKDKQYHELVDLLDNLELFLLQIRCNVWVAKDLSPQQQEQWRYYIRKFY